MKTISFTAMKRMLPPTESELRRLDRERTARIQAEERESRNRTAAFERTFRKIGMCEDAPCCGCCGPDPNNYRDV